MIEMRALGPGEAQLLRDGQAVGASRWETGTLAWPGERVTAVRVLEFRAPEPEEADFRAYLRYLWQKAGAAVAVWPGETEWFSQALEARWQAAGSPLALTP